MEKDSGVMKNLSAKYRIMNLNNFIQLKLFSFNLLLFLLVYQISKFNYNRIFIHCIYCLPLFSSQVIQRLIHQLIKRDSVLLLAYSQHLIKVIYFSISRSDCQHPKLFKSVNKYRVLSADLRQNIRLVLGPQRCIRHGHFTR